MGSNSEPPPLSSFDLMVVDLDLVVSSFLVSSSPTSSMDDVDSRRAVSNGEIDGSILTIGGLVRGVGVSSSFLMPENLEWRGVVMDEDDDGRSVRERTDVEDFDCDD